MEALDSIRYHYRRNEEALAADEIDKAVSWLKLAAGHAMPNTKDSFEKAMTDLELVASDLRNGRVADAAKVDAAPPYDPFMTKRTIACAWVQE